MEYPNPGVRILSFGVQGRFSGAMAKSRWEVENQASTMRRTATVSNPSLTIMPIVCWLLLLLALTIERLHRLRYLQRGTHPAHSAIDLLRLLRLSLSISMF